MGHVMSYIQQKVWNFMSKDTQCRKWHVEINNPKDKNLDLQKLYCKIWVVKFLSGLKLVFARFCFQFYILQKSPKVIVT